MMSKYHSKCLACRRHRTIMESFVASARGRERPTRALHHFLTIEQRHGDADTFQRYRRAENLMEMHDRPAL